MATKSKKSAAVNASDIDDFLTNSAPASKKASKVPVIKADALYDQLHNAYVAQRDAKAQFEALEQQFLEMTDKLYAERAASGDFSKSFNFPGLDTVGVQVSYKDQFKAIDVEKKGELEELLGDEYGQFFEEKREITLNDTSAETLAMLMEKLGKETCLSLFNRKLTISAKADMDRKQFNLQPEVRAMLHQYKPSVKLGK